MQAGPEVNASATEKKLIDFLKFLDSVLDIYVQNKFVDEKRKEFATVIQGHVRETLKAVGVELEED